MLYVPWIRTKYIGKKRLIEKKNRTEWISKYFKLSWHPSDASFNKSNEKLLQYSYSHRMATLNDLLASMTWSKRKNSNYNGNIAMWEYEEWVELVCVCVWFEKNELNPESRQYIVVKYAPYDRWCSNGCCPTTTSRNETIHFIELLAVFVAIFYWIGGEQARFIYKKNSQPDCACAYARSIHSTHPFSVLDIVHYRNVETTIWFSAFITGF